MESGMIGAQQVRDRLEGCTIWFWYYLHPDWQWEQSRHWHEDRYAVAVGEALDLMVQNGEFSFYFDTTSEFFSAVERRLGPRLDELRQRVREGRVRVVSGQVANCRPTQVGDETYIRNLQLGRRHFERHLPPTQISLLHSVDIAIGGVQMPQLLDLAGLKYYRAWRPHGPMNVLGIPHQFVWKGIDGSSVLVTRGAYGTPWREDSAPVRYEQADWDDVVRWLYENAFRDQLIHGRSPTGQLWLIQGYDDARPMTTVRADGPFDALGLTEEWRRREDIPIRWCTPVEYSEAVDAGRRELETVEGVLDACDVAYNIANHGANGLWAWRQMNDRRLLRAEWWAAAAASVGLLYPHERLERLWYLHCTYQAHAQDAAFEDDWRQLVDRARHVERQAERIAAESTSAIVRAAGGGSRTTRYIFNPHPWAVTADVEIYHPCARAGVRSLEIADAHGEPLAQQLVAQFRHPRFGGSINDERRLVRVDLPPMGYRRVEIVEHRDPRPSPQVHAHPDVIETGDLRLSYRAHALREVHDKATGQTYAPPDGSPYPALRFHVLDSDDWVFGGPEQVRIGYEARDSQWVEQGPLRWRHRSRGRLGGYEAEVDTTLSCGRREIGVSIRLEGHWSDPPLTGFASCMAAIAAVGDVTVDTPFAVEGRDPDHEVYAGSVPPGRDYGIDSMFERLRPGVFCARSWVDWSTAAHGITLISLDGNYYWLKEPEQIGHILLRCMKRPSGTWMQFCPESWTGSGTHEFDYVILFHDGQWRLADPQRRSLELRHPPTVVRALFPTSPTRNGGQHSFLRVDGPALLSAYRRDAEYAYVRVYENDGTGGQVVVELDWQPSSVGAVDLLGRPVDTAVTQRGSRVHVCMRPWQILTLRLGQTLDMRSAGETP